MMLDKKQTQVIFLFKFKIGHKAVETPRNINNAFGSGTTNEHTVRWRFKFCKGRESFEDEEHCAGPWKLTMTNWEQSSKLILLYLHDKQPKNSMSTICSAFEANWTDEKAQ